MRHGLPLLCLSGFLLTRPTAGPLRRDPISLPTRQRGDADLSLDRLSLTRTLWIAGNSGAARCARLQPWNGR